MNKFLKKIFVPLSIFTMAISGTSFLLSDAISHIDAQATTSVTVGNPFNAISGNFDTNFAFTAFKGTAGTAPAVNGGDIRLYQNGGYITVSSRVAGYKMTSLSISNSGASDGKGPFTAHYISNGAINDSDPSGWTQIGSGNLSWASNSYTHSDSSGFTHFKLVATGTSSSTRVYVDSISINYEDFSLPPVNVTGVSIPGDETRNIVVGETLQLTADITPNDATNKKVTWASSDSAKVSVSSTGLVTGLQATTAPVTITVITEQGNFSDSIEVNVSTVSATGVVIDQTDFSLIQDQTFQLTYTINPTNTTNKEVTWSSSNQSIVSVNLTGLITAIQPTESTPITITVTTIDGGFSDTVLITVTPNPVLLESVFGSGGENDWQVASGNFYTYFGHPYGNQTNLSLKTKNTFTGLKNRPVGTQISVEVVATSISSPGTIATIYGLDADGNRIATISQSKNIRYGSYSGNLTAARNDATANPTNFTLPISMTKKVVGLEVTLSSTPNSLLFAINVVATLGTSEVQAEALAGLVNNGDLNTANGKCEALLTLFETEYGLLNPGAKVFFDTSTDGEFVNAHQRLAYMEAWVTANSTGSLRENTFVSYNQSNTIYLVLIAGIGLSAILSYRFFLKRKND